MKRVLLNIYNFLIPKDSFLRYRLYSKFLWRIYCEPIDHILNNYFRTYCSSFFIQVGANDGVGFDRLRKFIVKYRLPGVLIEPVDFIFEKLKKNYRGNTGLFFENVAVSNKNETRTFYFVKSDSREKQHKYLLHYGSFDGRVLKENVNDSNNIVSKDIDCVSLNHLLTQYNKTQISLLMLDTEGFDCEIIRSIDFSSISVDMIVYEHKNLSNNDQEHCVELLRSKGYEFVFEGVDVLAISSNIYQYIK